MQKRIHLLIDDIRDLQCDLIARTPETGIQCLQLFKGAIACAYFDHDLGEDVASGLDVMKAAFDLGIMPDRVQLVTSNPVGRYNMGLLLLDNGFTMQPSAVDFIR